MWCIVAPTRTTTPTSSCYPAGMAWDQLTEDQRAKLEHAATVISARMGRTVPARALYEAVNRAYEAVRATAREWRQSLLHEAMRTPPYN
jgi:hypothetical protein